MESTLDLAQQLPPDDVAAIDELGKTYQAFRAELGKIIIGQDEVIERLGDLPVRPRPRPADGGSRPGQDPAGFLGGPNLRLVASTASSSRPT